MLKIKVKEKKPAEGEKPIKCTLYLPLWGNLYGLIASVAYKQYLKDKFKNPNGEVEVVEEVDFDCAESNCSVQENVSDKSKGELVCDNKEEDGCTKDNDEQIEVEIEGSGGKKQKYKLTAEELQIAKATKHLVVACIKELKRFRRKHGKLVLIDVKSDECDVTISI